MVPFLALCSTIKMCLAWRSSGASRAELEKAALSVQTSCYISNYRHFEWTSTAPFPMSKGKRRVKEGE